MCHLRVRRRRIDPMQDRLSMSEITSVSASFVWEVHHGFWPRPHAHAGELAIFVRLLIAVLAGAAVGWNRFRAGKPAGVGTHSLVALGSAMFVAIPVLMGALPGGDSATRVIQGVAAGIGFLGTGEIFRGSSTERGVHGLTSAAALWATAALGILAVCGSGSLSWLQRRLSSRSSTSRHVSSADSRQRNRSQVRYHHRRGPRR